MTEQNQAEPPKRKRPKLLPVPQTVFLTEKKCSRCKNTLAIVNFFKLQSSSDGFGSHCKKCSTEISRRSAKRRREREEPKGKQPSRPSEIDGEEWRDIPNHAPYQASNLGRIRNTKTGFLMKGGISNGYRLVCLSIAKRNKTYYVHVLVALTFIGKRPLDEYGRECEVNHKDLNRSNAALDNLEYVTKSENITHAYNTRREYERRK